jgi:CheY-like chemotaxis protein
MKKIIVCDDEHHIVEGLRHLLRGPGRTVVATHSGTETLAEIAKEKPDLLVTDIMMPGMSGLEVVSTLRASKSTHDLPIIILTARGQAQDASMAQEMWGATVVAKPFEPRKLRELVTSTLEGASCHSETSA